MFVLGVVVVVVVVFVSGSPSSPSPSPSPSASPSPSPSCCSSLSSNSLYNQLNYAHGSTDDTFACIDQRGGKEGGRKR